jgi:hypothetical protein
MTAVRASLNSTWPNSRQFSRRTNLGALHRIWETPPLIVDGYFNDMVPVFQPDLLSGGIDGDAKHRVCTAWPVIFWNVLLAGQRRRGIAISLVAIWQ